MSDSSRKTDFRLWGASHILALGTIERLSYNRRRYETSGDGQGDGIRTSLPSRDALLLRTDDIILNMQSYRNILQRYEDSEYEEGYTAALVLMLQRINNELYILHHDLLEMPADYIISVIPELDNQLRIWSADENNEDLANSSLPEALHTDQCIREMQSVYDILDETLPNRA